MSICAQEYNFIKYNVQEGLPQSQVYDIFQGSKSYIWIATQGGGVCKFDGNSFETITTRDGLPSNFIECIAEDSDNTLWFGTKNGIAAFDHKEVIWSGKSNHIVYTIAERDEAHLLLGTQEGLILFNKHEKKSTKLQLHPLLDISRINYILKVGRLLWIASSRGLYIIDGDHSERVILQEDLLTEDFKAIALDNQGHILAMEFSGRLSKIDIHSKRVIKTYVNSKIKKGQSIYVSNNNEIWISTLSNGIQIHKDPYEQSDIISNQSDQWLEIGEQEGLTHSNVKKVFEDSWGNIWIATSGGGLLKYLGQYFKHYNKSQGLIGNRIYAIEERSNNELWLSIGQEGITVIDSLGIRNDIDTTLIETKCNHIFEDSRQRMWMSTSEEGLVMHDSLGFHRYTIANGLTSNWIKSMEEDSESYLWVATFADGLARIKVLDSLEIEVRQFGKANGLNDLLMNSLKTDPMGRVWYTTKNGGIGYANAQRINDITSLAGLPKVPLRSIAFDSLKNVWIATAEAGIYHASYLDKIPQFEKLDTDKKLTSLNIYSLQFDTEGNLWAGSEVGVDKISLNRAGIVIDIQHFGRNEGFLGVETCLNSVELDSKGYLWFGTLNGLSRHKPGSTELFVSQPEIHFTSIDLNYADIRNSKYSDYLNKGDSLDTGIKLKHNFNNIGFKFQAVYPDQAEGIEYSWLLKGLDDDWTSGSRANAINYTNVPPGKYKFSVKAKSQNGQESNTLSTSFEIQPAFWQRLIFKVLMGLLLAFLLMTFVLFRIKMIKKREQKKRAVLELKNELLSLEQKALQLQMNPHFIFNALNSIQALVVNKKNDVAREQIQTFASLMRGILSNSKSKRISLLQEQATIDEYLKIEQFCQATPFDFSINLPKDHDPEEIELPPMLIQPFVENSIFHGISHLKKQGLIEVNFSVQNQLLICEIKDNGVGRKRARELEQSKNKGHQSVALEVTEKRLENLKGDKEYKAFEILDILDENSNIMGTKVLLRLPLEVEF